LIDVTDAQLDALEKRGYLDPSRRGDRVEVNSKTHLALLLLVSLWNVDRETGGISMFITVLAIICLKSNEKNSEQVIEKMADAARELGWPNQIVDATRMQMEAIAKMQVQTMDRMMDTWDEQIKSLNPASTMPSKLTSLPNFGPVGSWPNTGNPQMAALNALQFYIQVAQQWQKAWADAMASWAKANTSYRA
jgi:hypothetical protein